jgi:hypothetical protein
MRRTGLLRGPWRSRLLRGPAVGAAIVLASYKSWRRIASASADRIGGATSPDQFDGDQARRRGSRDRSHLGVRLVVPGPPTQAAYPEVRDGVKVGRRT